MRRGLLLRSLALLLLMAAVTTSAQSSSGSTSTSIFANSTTSTSNSSSPSASSKSQCEICRDSGDCSEAYKGTAGQFCNSSLDSSNNRRACCCPANDVCSSDNTYECTCQHRASTRPSYWIWIGLGVFAVGALIGGGIFMAIRKSRMQKRGNQDYPPQAGVAYAQQPVYGAGTYAQPVAYGQSGYAQPVYVQPGYGQGGYGYGDNYQRGGRRSMGTGGAVAMGVGGGLLGGLLIGEALGGMGGGGDGGGDGGEFAGDF